MSSQPPFEIAIIGAGVAGLTLAIGLLRRLHPSSSSSSSHPISITIYERFTGLNEIGAGIGFTANAERAMRALDPEIHAAFKRVTVQNGSDWFNWVDGEAEGETEMVHRMYLGERGFEGCARAEFLRELGELVPEGTVRFGKGLRGYGAEGGGGGGVRLEFGDGSEERADVVIGCDGIRSRVRQLLLGPEHPASNPGYSRKFAFRGLIDMARAREVLGHEKTDTRHMYLGPDGHALTFPVAGGKLLNVVAFTTDANREWENDEKFTAPAEKREAVAAFGGFNSTVRAIIDLLPDELDKWAIFDTFDHPAPTFAEGSVCISGDAAHAAAPYHGAGAGFAIEDAVVLAELLDRAVRPSAPWGVGRSGPVRAALETYSLVRMERARWLVETSRFVGEMYEWQDEKVGKDHAKCAEEIEWRSRQIWDYDIDAMVDQAVLVFTRRMTIS